MSARNLAGSGLGGRKIPQGMLDSMLAVLFGAGEQGVWYDPSDMATMFQDTAGTIPVTGVEQPVGLLLDKSKGLANAGNGDRVINQIQYSEDIRMWGSTNGTRTVDSIIARNVTGYHGATQSMAFQKDVKTRISFEAKPLGFSKVYVADGSNGRFSVAIDLLAGTSNKPDDTTITLDPVTGYYYCTFDFTTPVASGVGQIGISGFPDTGATFSIYGVQFTGDGVSGINLRKVDVRLFADKDVFPVYQKKTTGLADLYLGNHAIQITAAKRPVLSARVNQLVGSEQWNKLPATDGSSSVTQELTDLPPFLAGATVARVTQSGAATSFYQYATAQPVIQGAINARSFFVKPLAGCAALRGSTSTGDPFYFFYDLTTKVMTVGGNAGSATVVEMEAGWLRFTVTEKVASTVASRIFSVAGTATGASIGAVFLSVGYDCRPADQSGLPYQRVNTATDYDADPARFPAYLKFDGVDDAIAVRTIDFTGTDKVSAFAGVRKVSDAAAGILVELGTNANGQPGCFGIFAPPSVTTPAIQWTVRGATTAQSAAINALPAPATLVVTGLADIAAPISLIRRNGVVAATRSATFGGGNFSAAALNIGARNETSVYLNSQIYGLIIRGAASTPAQVAAAEHYLSLKTGVRLP